MFPYKAIMTKLWGPLGWMTLHSVSLNYPEHPSQADKILAGKFIDLFGETISCIHCKNHFNMMKSMYTSANPNYLDSKQSFALFVFRAHNTVNKRLDKPIQKTVAECLQTLKNATANTSLPQFRQAYLSYLMRNWGRDHTGEGMMMKGSVKQMIDINNQYWSPRDIPIPDLLEDDVMTLIENSRVRITPSGAVSNIQVGFRGGKLQLKRN